MGVSIFFVHLVNALFKGEEIDTLHNLDIGKSDDTLQLIEDGYAGCWSGMKSC